MNKIIRTLPLVVILLTLNINFVFGSENVPKTTKRAEQPVEIKVVPVGPTESEVEAAKRRAEQSPALQNKVRGAKYRLIGFNYTAQENTNKSLPARTPLRYQVFFYDYTNDRAIIAESDFAGKEPVVVHEELYDPGTGGKELEAAFELVKRDSEFGKLAEQKKLELFEPMPPVSNLKGERLVNVGVRNLVTRETQIIGVSFKNDRVVRYEGKAPPTARVAPEHCGNANANQSSTQPGVPGEYQISVIQDGVTTWEMLVVRPSSSSGGFFERSGVEIRNVKYKGKSVLKRGHAPILTVKYINDTCGPFRDWQFAEGFFDAPSAGATDPAPGIRILAEGQIAKTALETGNDIGNFQGVAIYRENLGFGTEVILVSELVAGHYRYIMEWRFAPDGTIRPRYGFGAVENDCVCAPHTHHVYWRFDFDVVTPNNKVFQVERGRKFLTPVTTEASIFRKYQTNRGFLIQNSSGNEAYQITPNVTDGMVTDAAGVLTNTFGAGDFWILKFKGTAESPDEIDDPNPNVTDFNKAYRATLEPWVNGESLFNQDVVIWYGAHDFHSEEDDQHGFGRPEVIQGKHVVGPDLRPVRW